MTVEMVVYGVGKSPGSDAPLVVLKESSRERFLAIGVGPLEIAGIAAGLADVRSPRPMTHDLLVSALEACGARVTQVVIHQIVDGVFHARLVLDVQGRHAELDSRSSDAIAIAVRTRVPIHVEESVVDKAGITPPAEGEAGSGGPGALGGPGGPGGPGGRGREDVPPGERISEEQLGAFRDVIKGLDMDDLDRPRGSR